MAENDQSQQKTQKMAPTPLSKILGYSHVITGDEQSNLNKPLVDPTGVSDVDRAFLNDVIAKVESGKINLLAPNSLINNEVYDKLDEMKQGKADMNALTLLSNVRQIKELHDLGDMDTYQAQNLVSSCRLMKERVEKECGDCYII